MRNHSSLVVSTPLQDESGKSIPIDTLAEIEALIGRAKQAGAPPLAQFRFRLTVGGKVRSMRLEWDD